MIRPLKFAASSGNYNASHSKEKGRIKAAPVWGGCLHAEEGLIRWKYLSCIFLGEGCAVCHDPVTCDPLNPPRAEVGMPESKLAHEMTALREMVVPRTSSGC